MANETLIDAAARAIAAKMVEQNHMLELVDDGEQIGVADDYDNKFYDCREMARAALGAIRELPFELRWKHGYDASAFAPEVTVSSIQFDPRPIWQRIIDAALS